MAKQNVLTRGKKQRAQALFQAGQLEEARILYVQVCEKDRSDTDAWSMLGLIHLHQRRYKEAEHCWQHQLSLNPQAVDALLNLAGIYAQQGKFEQATRYCHRAIQIQPANISARYNLGNAFKLQGEYQQAIEAYRQALKLQPHHPGTLLNLGLCLKKQGMYHEAIDCYQKILMANPSAMDAANNLAAAYLAMGQLDDAIAHRRQFLQRQPNFILGRSNLLFALNNSPAISPEALFQEHLRWGELVMGQCRQTPTHTNRPDKERRLRIGYVSPDFIGQHSVTYFIESLLANHDRQRFEIYGYAEVAIPDATTERFHKLCDHWSITHDKSDEEIAQDIQKDQIDILVDLAGHTASSRLTVFTRQPAPVQVGYLGYPNTTGLHTVDYRLTDAWADAPGRTERYHVEKLVRLPEGFLCYTPPADAPPVSGPPMEKTGYVTFGSFNALAKITPQVIALWAEIMKNLPESRMVLKSHALTDARVRERFRVLFEKENIESSRVSLHGHIHERSQHLAQYHEIDVALDSFPYNGTTTTCESLWMGVPVITLVGDAHAGRVGLSLLSQIGLTELACADQEEYKTMACKLARDLPRLKILRQGLRQRLCQSPLSDGQKHARAVEAAYREMWRMWCDRPAA